MEFEIENGVFEQNVIAVIESLLETDLFTKKNIDKFITKAIDGGKTEIQLLLTDYKNQIGGYTDIETDIKKRFNL